MRSLLKSLRSDNKSNDVDKEYHFALADAFAETIKSALGPNWSPRHEECWNDTLGGLKHNVYLAAQEHLPEPECKRHQAI